MNRPPQRLNIAKLPKAILFAKAQGITNKKDCITAANVGAFNTQKNGKTRWHLYVPAPAAFDMEQNHAKSPCFFAHHGDKTGYPCKLIAVLLKKGDRIGQVVVESAPEFEDVFKSEIVSNWGLRDL